VRGGSIRALGCFRILKLTGKPIMDAQMTPLQANRITARPELSIVIGSIVLLAVAAAGVLASTQTNPPAGTFPARVGEYRLKRGPEHEKNYFEINPVDSWGGYYELAQNNSNSIGVRYTLMTFSSPKQAKQALKLYVDINVAGRREKGYRARIVQQGRRPHKPKEKFAVLDIYFRGGESRLVSTTALWTDGSMLIRVESPSGTDPEQKRFEQENGLREAAPINFMKIYPN
jgi:hypothetical protein